MECHYNVLQNNTISNLKFPGELWSVYCWNLGENWSHYNGTILYMVTLHGAMKYDGLNKMTGVLLQISSKFASKGPIDNKATLYQEWAWCLTGENYYLGQWWANSLFGIRITGFSELRCSRLHHCIDLFFWLHYCIKIYHDSRMRDFKSFTDKNWQ